MKYLIFFGSPRHRGSTARLLRYLCDRLPGEKIVIDAYRRRDIAPCVDCRRCWREKGCAMSDGMAEIYQLAEECDRILFASPVYFYSLPAPLKQIVDRFQVYWAGRIRGDMPEPDGRRGAVLLVGGAPSFPEQFAGAERACTSVLADLGIAHAGTVVCPDSDRNPPAEQEEVREALDELAKALS